MIQKTNHSLITFLAVLAIMQINVLADNALDEVYTESGTIKSQYEQIIGIYENLSPSLREKLQEQSQIEFDGDNKLLMLPKVISEEESDLLNRGVSQRAKAIMAFLEDHYSGEKNYLRDGLIPEDVINRILHRSGDAFWQDYLGPTDFSFDYGPDIIRAPGGPQAENGVFHVVEDNIDYVGGRGDLIRAREIIDRHIPEYQAALNSPDPKDYYDQLARQYHQEAHEKGGMAVILSYPKSIRADNEEERYERIFKERGIPSVEAPNLFSEPEGFPRLEVKEEGVYYLSHEGASPKKVGHIIANMNPEHIEPNHPATEIVRVLKEARYLLDNPETFFTQEGGRERLQEAIKPNQETGAYDLEKIKALLKENGGDYTLFDSYKGYQGIIDNLKKGHLTMTNTPGASFVSDKEFYIYMEEVIRYYLSEEPIIKNMESGSFFKKGKFDKKMADLVFENFDQWVIKVVDGRGGKGVYVGPKTPASEIPKIKKLIEAEPSRYKWQRYNPLSTLNNEYIGDIRVLSRVGHDSVVVSQTPWARVVETSGNGKVNISDNGFEAVVMVKRATKQKSCFSLMKALLKR